MLKRPVLIATVAAAMATAALSTQANAGDPVLGALVGGGIGAAIGHSINGVHGAWAGGALGAVVGASAAADSNRYSYGGGYAGPSAYYGPSTTYYQSAPTYYQAAPVYYEPAPVYYEPAPVYYTPAPVYYSPRVVYRSGPRYVAPYRSYVSVQFSNRGDWRGYGHHGHHGRWDY
ncbi:MAG: hypothetical protein ABIS17_00600 [Casimicrobiaceae bacterium]